MFERNDFVAHEQTYRGFLALAKWATIVLAIAVIALYFLVIANAPWVGWPLLIIVLPAMLVLKTIGSLRH